MKESIKVAFFACTSIVVSVTLTTAIADSKQECIVGGRVFEEAMLAEVMEIAYGEQIEWRRVDYYTLPKNMQKRIEADVVAMRPSAQSSVDDVQGEIYGWNRQGMDGDSMAKQILLRGFKGIGETYAIKCLKELQESESKPESLKGGKINDTAHRKTRT